MGPLPSEKLLDEPHCPGSDAQTFPPNHPHPPLVGIFLKSCVLYWKWTGLCFLPRVGCFSVKIIFLFNSCCRSVVVCPLGHSALLVLCLRVLPTLVVTQSEKLGPIWDNVHAPWLAPRPEVWPLSPLLSICTTGTVLSRSTGPHAAPHPIQAALGPLPGVPRMAPHLLSRPMSTHPSSLNSAPPPAGSPLNPQVGLSVLPVSSIMPSSIGLVYDDVPICPHCIIQDSFIANDENPIRVVQAGKKMRSDGSQNWGRHGRNKPQGNRDVRTLLCLLSNWLLSLGQQPWLPVPQADRQTAPSHRRKHYFYRLQVEKFQGRCLGPGARLWVHAHSGNLSRAVKEGLGPSFKPRGLGQAWAVGGGGGLFPPPRPEGEGHTGSPCCTSTGTFLQGRGHPSQLG